MHSTQPHKFPKEHQILIVLLLAGLVNGLLYIIIVPPWQHYDEPVHFEYAWWLANRGYPYHSGDYDQALHREVAASLIQYGFFNGLSVQPNMVSQTEPIWIGIPQYADPPLYYALVSLPLRLIKTTDVIFQLYIARLVSLTFFLLTIVISYGVVREFVHSPESPLIWAVPLMVALLPGFADLMTAVNNDVGATFTFSLFIWGSLRILLKGRSIGRVFWIIISAIACYFTKNTVQLAIPLALFVLILTYLPKKQRHWAWVGLGTGVVIMILIGLGWGDAAQWYRETSQQEPTRATVSLSKYGSKAFDLYSQSGKEGNQLLQPFFRPGVDALAGQMVTLGAWIWSDQPTIVDLPSLDDGITEFTANEVQVGIEPAFFTSQYQLSENIKRVVVVLHASSEPGKHVYYDGITFVNGLYPKDQIPEFKESLQTGTWGGKQFVNQIRNASAERGWYHIRSWTGRLIGEAGLQYANTLLAHFIDLDAIRWYYPVTSQNLLRTFWAKFGWGDVILLGSKPYRWFFGISLLGGLGSLLFAWHYHQKLISSSSGILAICLVLIWGSAFYRGILSLVDEQFIPSARYAFPAIIPTVILLIIGWFEIINSIKKRWNLNFRYGFLFFGLAFIYFNLYALKSIWAFYHGIGLP